MDSDESHFNISLIVKDKVARIHKPQPVWRERRAETVLNRCPSAYLPNALPLGQTGSQVEGSKYGTPKGNNQQAFLLTY